MTEDKPKLRHPRDGAGSVELNNPDDGTPIREMIGLDEFMLIVTDRCTYRVQLADQIDPGRTNPKLPFTSQQLLFNHGAESDLLCRSLFHARRLFRKEFQSIDVLVAMNLTLEAVSHLIAMSENAKRFSDDEIEAVRKVENLKRKGPTLILPAMGDVRGACKAFIQRADHCSDAILEIVRLFEPGMKAQPWSKFPEMFASRYGENDPFVDSAKRLARFMQMMKDARDCFEHQRPGIITKDFSANADGTVSMPSIAIDYRKTKQPQVNISAFMAQAADSMLNVFESVTVHLCARQMKGFAGMPWVVDLVPEEYKANWRSRYCYGMYYADGKFVPCS